MAEQKKSGSGGAEDEVDPDHIGDSQRASAEAMSLDQLERQRRLIESEIKFQETQEAALRHAEPSMKDKIKQNMESIKLQKTPPWLVAHVIEILDAKDCGAQDDDDMAGSGLIDSDDRRSGKCAVVKTSLRQTVFLPSCGLLDPATLKPQDLLGVQKDSVLMLDHLPEEFDSRVKAMEVDEKPKEDMNNDVGGLEEQITEMMSAVEFPIKYRERFETLGIEPPNGVLLYGEPGTGKTMLARACAARVEACFLKLAGPQLVQMYIGDGAKIVRDAFKLANQKKPAIIFIDELDAIGSRRFDSEKNGDREVQRTMLELLNQMDGFSSKKEIKVVAATNRIDVLDPALLRSGRFDRKIEFLLPDVVSREKILVVHSRRMTRHAEVNFEELARCTPDFNGAMLKAVCVEAGMIALRQEKSVVTHEHYMDGIAQVQSKKKMALNYYA